MDNGAAAMTVGDKPRQDQEPVSPGSNSRPSLAVTPKGKHGGHKRSLSGSILSRLNSWRMQSEQAKPLDSSQEAELDQTPEDDEQAHDNGLFSPAPPESAMMLAQRAAKQRKRKGSLRKTALLGTTGRLKTEGKERRNSLLQMQRAKVFEEQSLTVSHMEPAPLPPHLPHEVLVERHAHSTTIPADADYPPTSHSNLIDGEEAQYKLSLDTIRGVASPSTSSTTGLSTLASPIISPTSQSYTSTTDDDESLTLPNSALKRPPMASSGSYFPAQPPITRRRSSKKPPSPLSAIPANAYGTDDEYEYSDTEWWGWVVLIVTWIVFVVGMGSCFGLWSWAWDVGETPYAPPELEDDATLPIVGYYPALIILSGVMAWVWVVVAWVGMKYFKHAKMAGEDA